jgi:FAD/FMN-containing dehydrogenase
MEQNLDILLKNLREDFKFEGDMDIKEETLKIYSRDASLFEIKPQVVLFPKHSIDVQAAVKWVNEHKASHPELSLL